jgi:hypothetical protein
MFIATSRRRSPSTGNFAMTSRRRVISGSVRSLTCVLGSTPAALQVITARFRPMPKMCVSAMPTCLLVGILTPAIRAIVVPLTLALLVPRVFANHAHDTAPAHDLALPTNLSN